jgi:hypothetical protein
MVTLNCFFFCAVLQPAQSYDIAEKIKLANQELDETPLPTTPINRVVRFRSVLEDYEPEYPSDSNSKLNENFEGKKNLHIKVD